MNQVTEQLFKAAKKGNLEDVRLAIKNGAKISSFSSVDGNTALHLAAKYDHPDVVKELLNNGAQANNKNKIGKTPLHFAAEGNHLDVIHILLNKGAEVNSEDRAGRTPLHFAAINGYPDSVRILLDGGAHINWGALNDSDKTAMHYASEYDHPDVLTLLLDRGARSHYTTIETERSPLFVACQLGNLSAVRVLLDREGNVNEEDSHDDSILAWSIGRDHWNVAEELIYRGAIVNVRSAAGRVGGDGTRECRIAVKYAVLYNSTIVGEDDGRYSDYIGNCRAEVEQMKGKHLCKIGKTTISLYDFLTTKNDVQLGYIIKNKDGIDKLEKLDFQEFSIYTDLLSNQLKKGKRVYNLFEKANKVKFEELPNNEALTDINKFLGNDHQSRLNMILAGFLSSLESSTPEQQPPLHLDQREVFCQNVSM